MSNFLAQYLVDFATFLPSEERVKDVIANASRLTTGLVAPERLAPNPLATKVLFGNNTWGDISGALPPDIVLEGDLAAIAFSGSASDLITGTVPLLRLPSQVARTDLSNVFAQGNTFQATQVFEASVCVGTGGLGPRIRQGTGQVFRLNNNADTARADLEAGAATFTGAVIAQAGVTSRDSGNAILSLSSTIAYAGNGNLALYSATSGNGAQIYLGDSNYRNSSYWNSAPGIGAVGSAPTSELAFYVYTGSVNSRTEAGRFTSSSVLQLNGGLTVAGTSTFTGRATFNGDITLASSSFIERPDGNILLGWDAGGDYIAAGSNAGTARPLGIGANHTQISIRTGGVTRAKIFGNGNFQIGDNADNGALLQVFGTSNISGAAQFGSTLSVTGAASFSTTASINGILLKNAASALNIRNSSDTAYWQVDASGISVNTGGVQWRDLTTNSEHWRLYKNNSDPTLYLRDMVNARMLVQFGAGATSGSAFTIFLSNVNIDAALRVVSNDSYIGFSDTHNYLSNTTNFRSGGVTRAFINGATGEATFNGLITANGGITTGFGNVTGGIFNAQGTTRTGYYEWRKNGVRQGYVGYDDGNNISFDNEVGGYFTFFDPVQIGFSGNVIRWSPGTSRIEVRNNTNDGYGSLITGDLRATNETGGSIATPGNIRVGLMTQSGAYLAGALTGRTYSNNSAHGDVIISANSTINLGINDYSNLTDDFVIRGNTGNVEINRGRLIVTSSQTGNTLQATYTNTSSGQPAGFRLSNSGWDIGFRTNPSNGWFEITDSGGNIQHRWNAKDYLIASDGRLYFSSQTNFATSGIGAQDVSIGRASAGVLRVYNSAGADGSIQAANGTFSGNVTGTWTGNAVGILYGGTGATTAQGARTNLLPSQTGNSGRILTTNGTDVSWTAVGTGGVGDVIGPASSTDNAVVRFDGTTGKLVQNSATTIDDSGNITTNGKVKVGGATGMSIVDEVDAIAFVKNSPTWYGEVRAERYKLANYSHSVVADHNIMTGEWAGGYNLNILGRVITGESSGVEYKQDGIKWYSETYGVPGPLTPRMTLSPTTLAMNGAITSTGNLTVGTSTISSVAKVMSGAVGTASFLSLFSSGNLEGYIAQTSTAMHIGVSGGLVTYNATNAQNNAAITIGSTNNVTFSGFIEIGGSSGPIIRNNSSTIEIRDTTNATFAPLSASTITANGSRPVTISPSNGTISIQGSSGGWANDLRFLGSSGTHLTGFGANGTDNTLNYAYIGTFASPVLTALGTGNVGIGTTAPAARLEVASVNAGSSTRLGFRIDSVRATADLEPHIRFVRTAIAGWNLAQPSSSLTLYLDGNSANPEFTFAQGGIFVANTQVKLGNTSGVRLKNSNGLLQVRNDGDTAAAKISASHALIGRQYFGDTSYSFSNGQLIVTDIAVTDNMMFEMTIEGNSYNNAVGPNFTRVQAYNYTVSGTIINTSAFSTDPAFTIDLFHYNGFVCAWFAQTGSFQTYTIKLISFDNKTITSITNVAKPTTGVTNSVTITPYKLWTQANDGAGSGMDADLLDGQHGSYYATASSVAGTLNYVPKFTSSSAIGNSQIFDNGTNVGIGTTTLTHKLTVNGTASFGGGASAAGGTVTTGGNNSYAQLMIGSAADQDAFRIIQAGNWWLGPTENTGLHLQTNSLTRLTIANNGNSIFSNDLSVSGSLQTNGTFTATNGYSYLYGAAIQQPADGPTVQMNPGRLAVGGASSEISIQDRDAADNTFRSVLYSNGGLFRVWRGTDRFTVSSTATTVIDQLNVNSGIIRLGTSINPEIGPGTSDGSDNRILLLVGGGAYGPTTRGAHISVHGLDSATRPGNIELWAGQNGDIRLGGEQGGGHVVALTVRPNGSLRHRTNVWHQDDTGANRYYYTNNGTTFYSGQGATAHIFRNGSDVNLVSIDQNGLLVTQGTNSGIDTLDRVSGERWVWYGSGGIARLFSGVAAVDLLLITNTGNTTFGNSILFDKLSGNPRIFAALPMTYQVNLNTGVQHNFFSANGASFTSGDIVRISGSAGYPDTVNMFSIHNSSGVSSFNVKQDGRIGSNMEGVSLSNISVAPFLTSARVGVNIFDYGTLGNNVNQSAFNVSYMGGSLSGVLAPVTNDYRNILTFRTGGTSASLSGIPSFAIRCTIGSIIGSSMSEVITSFMTTSTATGLTIPRLTMNSNLLVVDFPQGSVQLGTNVILKNNSGALNVRDSADSTWAPISGSNITAFGFLDIQNPTITTNGWWGFDVSGGTTSTDSITLNSRNTGANFVFRRDGGLNSSFFVVGSGPQIRRNVAATAVQIMNATNTAYGDLEFAGATFATRIENTSYSTGTSMLRLGSFELQPFALNNNIIADNMYYDGGAFRRRQTGTASALYFLNGEVQLRAFASDAAASAVNNVAQFKVFPSGKIASGPSISGASNLDTGANFVVESDGAIESANNTWHTSLTDGLRRLYYGTSGTSYYAGHGTGVVHEWRSGASSDVTRMTLSNGGILSVIDGSVSVRIEPVGSLSVATVATSGATRFNVGIFGTGMYSDYRTGIYILRNSSDSSIFSVSSAGEVTASSWVKLGGDSGPLLRNNSGVIEARNSTNSAYSELGASRLFLNNISIIDAGSSGGIIQVLTTTGSAQGVKAGSMVLSNTYTDNAPTNGLFVKGNVGLDVASPLFKLQSNGPINAGDGPFINLNAASQYFFDGNVSYYHIPGSMIRKDSSATVAADILATLVLYNRNGTNNTGTKLAFVSNESTSTGSNAVTTAAIVSQKLSGVDTGWASGNLKFLVKNGSTYTEALTIDSSGNSTFSGNLISSNGIRVPNGQYVQFADSVGTYANMGMTRLSSGAIRITAPSTTVDFLDGVTNFTSMIRIGSANLIRYNTGNTATEFRTTDNSQFSPVVTGHLSVVEALGGSNATPANTRLRLMTQINAYMAGAISGRTYSANAAHGDIVLSANPLITTLDYSNLTDDLVVRGNTGHVEINRGRLILNDVANASSWSLKTQYSDSVGQLDFINHSSVSRISVRQDGQTFITGSNAGTTFQGLTVQNIAANASGLKTRIRLPVFNGSEGGVIEEIGNSIDGYRLNIYSGQASGVLTFGTGGDNERMRISASGDVGIGATSPLAKFHVRRSSGTHIRIGVSDANADTVQGGIDWFSNDAGTPDFFGSLRMRFQGGTGVVNRQMQFLVADSATPKMTLDGNGNLTIAGTIQVGTSGPILKNNSGLLQVRNSTDTGFASVSALIGSFTNTAIPLYAIRTGGTGTDNATLQIGDGTIAGSIFFMRSGGGGNASVGYKETNSTGHFTITSAGGGGFITLDTGAGEAMRVVPARRVLIGTTTDDTTNLLQVAGSTTMTGNLTVGGTFNVTGSITNTYTKTHNLTRTLPATVGDYVDIGTFSFTNGAGLLDIAINVGISANSQTKFYKIPCHYSATSNNWRKVSSLSGSPNYAGNDFDLEVRGNGGNTELRIRKTSGTVGGTIQIAITQYGRVDLDTFTASTATGSGGAPTALATEYPRENLVIRGIGGSTEDLLIVRNNVGSNVARITHAGQFVMANGVNHTSLTDSLPRMIFNTSGTTILRGHGTEIFAVQNNAGSNMLLLGSTGNLSAQGNISAGIASSFMFNNMPYFRAAQLVGSNGIVGGYNIEFNGTNVVRNASGSVSGYMYQSNTVNFYAEPSAAPATITPKMTLSDTLLLVNENVRIGDASSNFSTLTIGKSGSHSTLLSNGDVDNNFVIQQASTSTGSMFLDVGTGGLRVRPTGTSTDIFRILNSGNTGIGVNPTARFHVVEGANTFKFNSGASSITPNISIGTSGGKSVALLVGTAGSTFTFDNTGFFGIAVDSKANIDGGSSNGGTVLLRIQNNGSVGFLKDVDHQDSDGLLRFRFNNASSTSFRGYSSTPFRLFNASNSEIVSIGQTGIITAGTPFADSKNGTVATTLYAQNLFNNMGLAHASVTDFNSVNDFGFRYVQGSTNGPGTGSSQFYNITLGTGIDYDYSQYALQLAIPRYNSSDKYLSMRTREAGTWGSWQKIAAGTADGLREFTWSGKPPANSTKGPIMITDTVPANTIWTSDGSVWRSQTRTRKVITYAATITLDSSEAMVQRITLTGNLTLNKFTNGFDGASLEVLLRQDGTGGRTLTFGTGFRFNDYITSITLSTGANKTDRILFEYDAIDDVWDVISFVKGS